MNSLEEIKKGIDTIEKTNNTNPYGFHCDNQNLAKVLRGLADLTQNGNLPSGSDEGKNKEALCSTASGSDFKRNN